MNFNEGSNKTTNIPTQYGSVMILLNESSLILRANEDLYSRLGYTSDEVKNELQDNLFHLVLESDKARLLDVVKQLKNSQAAHAYFRVKKKDGGNAFIHLDSYQIDTKDCITINCDLTLDMTETNMSEERMKHVQTALTQLNEAFRNTKNSLDIESERNQILRNLSSDIIFEYNMDNDFITFSGNYEQCELDTTEISNFLEKLKDLKELYPEDREKCIEFLKGDLSKDIEFRFYNKSGSIVWYMIKGVLLNHANHKTIMGFIYNIDEQKKEKERLINQSRLDSLTNVYNQTYTKRAIDEYLLDEGKDSSHSFILVDINNFSLVNENLGHLFANTVLTNIAERLKVLISENDIIGRIDGDKFLILIKNEWNHRLLEKKAKEICNICNNTYTGENKDYKISCSIGITLYPQDGKDYFSLFKNADLALFLAKKMGKNSFQFFKEDNLYHKNKLEYYNNYNIVQTCENKVSNFDREIINFAFDIMAKTKDVNSAIYLLLDQVAKHFNVSHVWIMEKKVDDPNLNISYLWSNKSGILDKERYGKHMNLAQEDYINLFDNNGVFYLSDYNQYKETCSKFKIKDIETKAFLQCGIFEDEVFKGLVCLNDSIHTRNWSTNEIDSLIMLTKIISAYILKIRASERTQKRLDKMKNFDYLTGLPSLHKFKKDVSKVISLNPSKQYAVVYSDICNFKYVNDTLGFEEGDKILSDFADLLSGDIINSECIARISSDKFILLMEYNNDESMRAQILSMSDHFNAQQKAKNLNLNLAIVSGICIIDSSHYDIMKFIDNANIARKSLKPSLKSICKFYDSSMLEKIKREMEIVNSMEKALRNREFVVYLQPKIDLKDNRLVGAEALVRWKKADNTIVPPNDFIPIFENNGFIVNLDFYIYEEVCKLLRTWADKNNSVIPISVNVSRVHLNDENFVYNFKQLVNKYTIPPDLLELELTESIFLDNTETAIATMKEFKNLGFGVSIDDFGAGYSSLNLLKDLTTDVLKLDKEFFRQGEMQREDQIIVSSIINMAKQLNMKVISEGVETQMQSDFLKGISCDMAQGYLYAKPMPILEFEELMLKSAIK